MQTFIFTLIISSVTKTSGHRTLTIVNIFELSEISDMYEAHTCMNLLYKAGILTLNISVVIRHLYAQSNTKKFLSTEHLP